MTDQPIDEAEILAFRAQLESSVHVDRVNLQRDVSGLVANLLAAETGKALTRFMLDFATAQTSKVYVTYVLEEALKTWATWVLHEGNVVLVGSYMRHLPVYVMAARIIGLEKLPESPHTAEQGGTDDGHTAENGAP